MISVFSSQITSALATCSLGSSAQITLALHLTPCPIRSYFKRPDRLNFHAAAAFHEFKKTAFHTASQSVRLLPNKSVTANSLPTGAFAIAPLSPGAQSRWLLPHPARLRSLGLSFTLTHREAVADL